MSSTQFETLLLSGDFADGRKIPACEQPILFITRSTLSASVLRAPPDSSAAQQTGRRADVVVLTDRLLPRHDVERLVGLGRSAIYQRMSEGKFPRPVHMFGGKAVRWWLSDILEWLGALQPSTEDGSRAAEDQRSQTIREKAAEPVDAQSFDENPAAHERRRAPIRADSDRAARDVELGAAKRSSLSTKD